MVITGSMSKTTVVMGLGSVSSVVAHMAQWFTLLGHSGTRWLHTLAQVEHNTYILPEEGLRHVIAHVLTLDRLTGTALLACAASLLALLKLHVLLLAKTLVERLSLALKQFPGSG